MYEIVFCINSIIFICHYVLHSSLCHLIYLYNYKVLWQFKASAQPRVISMQNLFLFLLQNQASIFDIEKIPLKHSNSVTVNKEINLYGIRIIFPIIHFFKYLFILIFINKDITHNRGKT